jgi:hypothetical protein
MVMWRCPGCELSLFCHVCVNIGLGRSGWSFSSCLFDKIGGLMNSNETFSFDPSSLNVALGL